MARFFGVSFFTALAMLVGLGLSFFVQLYFARELSLEAFGVFSLVLSTATLIAVIGRLGFLNLTIKEVVHYLDENQYRKASEYLTTMFLSVAFGVFAVYYIFKHFYRPLGDNLNDSFLVYILVISLSISMGGMFSSIFRSFGKPYNAVIATKITEQFLLIVCVFIYSHLYDVKLMSGEDVVFLLAISYFSSIFFTTLIYLFIRPDGIEFTKVSVGSAKAWLLSSLSLSIIVGGQMLLKQTDALTVGYLLEVEKVGLYSAVSRLSELAGFVLVAINFVVAPKIVVLYKSNNITPLNKLLLSGTAASFSAGLVVFLAVLLWGDVALGLYGDEFYSVFIEFKILVFGKLLHTLFGFGVLILTMCGLYRDLVFIFVFCVILNLILNVMLVDQFMLVGAASATVISSLILDIWVAFVAFRKLRVGPLSFYKGN